MFDVNSPILYILVSIVILLVLGQSVFFLLRALRRAREIGMDKELIKKTISSSAIFTIAPAVSVLVGVITLSVSMGVPFPWLRLSVIGSISYETVAAGNALTALGLSLSEQITDPSAFITVALVMTFGIVPGIILVPALTKKIQSGMLKIENKDKKWSEILNSAMFMGMISAFLGFVFCDMTGVFTEGKLAGLIPVCVMVVSSLVMGVCGFLAKKCHMRWMFDYALPISLVAGMASAIPFTNWLA